MEHGNGYVTIYAHLSSRDVQKGETVYRGQKIGEVGNTGRSTAPHLHYEVKYQSQSIDPSEFYFDTYMHYSIDSYYLFRESKLSLIFINIISP